MEERGRSRGIVVVQGGVSWARLGSGGRLWWSHTIRCGSFCVFRLMVWNSFFLFQAEGADGATSGRR